MAANNDKTKVILEATVAFNVLKKAIEAALKTNVVSLHYDRDEKLGHILTVKMTWSENMTPDDIDTTLE